MRARIGDLPLGTRGGPALDLHYGVASYPHDGKSPDFLLKVADLRLYQCRSQSSFAHLQRLHPRFSPDEMSLRMEWNGRPPDADAPVVDISYGRHRVPARKRERCPKRWKAEIVQKHDPERHPIRLRALHTAPLPDGGVRVGCAYL